MRRVTLRTSSATAAILALHLGPEPRCRVGARRLASDGARGLLAGGTGYPQACGRGLMGHLLRRLDHLASNALYLLTGVEAVDERNGFFPSNRVEVLVVDLEARRPVARRQTFRGLERELAVL